MNLMKAGALRNGAKAVGTWICNCGILLTVILLGMVTFPGSVLAQSAASMPRASPSSQSPAKAERHPEIHAAIRALERAKADLQKAARDFDGHRAKAVKAIENALGELRAALESDRR